LAAASFLKAWYLSYFSKPAGDRILYPLIQRHKVRRILELGLGSGRRAVRMIEMAQRRSTDCRVSYTGIDLFESRGPSDPPGMTIKAAHQLLGATGARVRLIPGDPGSALARTANELMGTDLVIISAGQDAKSMQRAWAYLPRVIHAGSCVIRQEIRDDGGTVTWVLAAAEIERLAAQKAAA